MHVQKYIIRPSKYSPTKNSIFFNCKNISLDFNNKISIK